MTTEQRLVALANNQRTLCQVVEHLLRSVEQVNTAACLRKLKQIEHSLERHFDE